MAKNSFRKQIDPYLTTQNIVLVAFVFVALLVLIIQFFGNLGGGTEAQINKDQIRMEKNGEIITVNRNGLVEYRTEEVVTYQIWDSDKVSKFFVAVENKARDYLENPNDSGNCVFVSLYLDGELVTLCFSEDDDVVNEAYEEFEDDTDDTISLSDLFNDEEDGSEDDNFDDISMYFEVTPTPTPAPTSTPTEGGGDSGGTQLPPPLPVEATCESWEEQIVGGRAIISNTLCSVSVSEE